VRGSWFKREGERREAEMAEGSVGMDRLAEGRDGMGTNEK